jgi:GntR family transcriptional repressor for pyruvate dehydrogenase complex
LGAVFSRIEHVRTADEVVQQIETLILEGVLRVADRLPAERELARQFDVSRPILRDALKVLEQRGLIVTRHGGGTYVADVIGQVFTQPVMDLIVSHPKAAADYLEYRRAVESIAAEFAARRATDDDRALLAEIMLRMQEAHARGEFEEEAAIDVEFHNAIGECAHNIVLLHTLRSCYRLLSDGVFRNRLMVFALPGARSELLAQHRAIHDAVAAGDPEAARAASVQHIDFIERAMAEVERSDDWRRVSRLRLSQRSEGGVGGKRAASGATE